MQIALLKAAEVLVDANINDDRTTRSILFVCKRVGAIHALGKTKTKKYRSVIQKEKNEEMCWRVAGEVQIKTNVHMTDEKINYGAI